MNQLLLCALPPQGVIDGKTFHIPLECSLFNITCNEKMMNKIRIRIHKMNECVNEYSDV